MITVTVVGIVVALAALVGSQIQLARVVSASIERPGTVLDRPITDEVLLALRFDTDANRIAIESLTLAVSDGIARVDRAENRISKTVTSARRLVREAGLEHAGIEAEYTELHDGDEPPSEPVEVPKVQEDLGLHRPSGIPGVTGAARLQEMIDA